MKSGVTERLDRHRPGFGGSAGSSAALPAKAGEGPWISAITLADRHSGNRIVRCISLRRFIGGQVDKFSAIFLRHALLAIP